MNVLQKQAKLAAWVSSWPIYPSPAARAIAASLAAAWLYTFEEADLTITPWSNILHWADAAMQNDKKAIGHLDALERQFEETPLSLIAADADQIQAYVFESAKISEVRGASALIEWLNFKGLKEIVRCFGLPEDVLIYQGGGGAMLLLPTVIADDMRQAIEEQFLTMTYAATITTAGRIVGLCDLLERRSFQAARTDLMHKLQIRKLQKQAPIHFEWLPFARRCEACEVRPAWSIHQRSADHPLLCEVCYTKREEGYAQRLPLHFEDFLEKQFCSRHVPSYLRDVRVGRQTAESFLRAIDRAEDLEEISHNGYVGVIVADGDGIGSKLTQLNSLAEFAHFSENLYRLSTECVYWPLSTNLRATYRRSRCREQTQWFHPFELIALGGDDVFLVVPANKAISIAQGIVNEWDRRKSTVIPPGRTGDIGIMQPTLSLGLLICPYTFPLYFMRQLAEKLLLQAKSARSKANASEGFIDFLILRSSGTPRTDAGQIQETLYRYREPERGGDATLHLTERPYSMSAFDSLTQTAYILKQAGLTHTQRQALARSLRLGRMRSTMDVLLYWARRPEHDEKGRQIRECFRKWIERLQTDSDELVVFPWHRDEKRRRETWKTQLFDVLELMEWVEATENHEIKYDSEVDSRDAS